MAGDNEQTVKECLKALDVTAENMKEVFAGCNDLNEEFAVIRKIWLKGTLIWHPDKGGSAEKFRAARLAWESLKELKEHPGDVTSFVSAASEGKSAHTSAFFDPTELNTWEFYDDAALEVVPPYRVELAKSNRSKCNNKKCEVTEDHKIAKDDIRLGSMNAEAGTYNLWRHLACWRVPSKIWLGLPKKGTTDRQKFKSALHQLNEVMLSGWETLDEASQEKLVDFVMNPANWARYTVSKKVPKNMLEGPEAPDGFLGTFAGNQVAVYGAGSSAGTGTEVGFLMDGEGTEVVRPKSKGVFKMPQRTPENAHYLNGKTIVITGLFPEIGGGQGLTLGKERLKAMLTSFGAKVTSAISGQTDLLVVGKEPGSSKVSKAEERMANGSKLRMLTIEGIRDAIEGRIMLEDAPPPRISSFSAGYFGRGGSKKIAPSVERKEVAEEAYRSEEEEGEESKKAKKGKKGGKKGNSKGKKEAAEEEKGEAKKKKKATSTSSSKGRKKREREEEEEGQDWDNEEEEEEVEEVMPKKKKRGGVGEGKKKRGGGEGVLVDEEADNITLS